MADRSRSTRKARDSAVGDAPSLAEIGAVVECLCRLGEHEAMARVIRSMLPAPRAEDIEVCFGRFAGERVFRRCPREGDPRPFRMGAAEVGDAQDGAATDVEVRLTRPLWVMATSVTLGGWSLMAPHRAHVRTWGADPSLPVTRVCWFEARLYARWLEHWRRAMPSVWEQILPREASQHRLTLPTEAQREYFTRAGTNKRFWCGDDDKKLPRVAWCESNSARRVHAVGEKPANPFGLHDVHGNVLEWCLDWHADALTGGADPRGPANGRFRMLRGGSYWYEARLCSSSRRFWNSPDFARDGAGFRLVCTAQEREPDPRPADRESP
ncbi:MAG: formylglycine-generating enzyme family protein [Planctomycetota bacterium]